MPASLKERLLSQREINPITGCWLFTGAIISNGYGLISVYNKRLLVHRLSAFLFKGFDINSGLLICHINECPNRHCFNPEHIKEGTHISNMQDMRDKNKYCKYGHFITGIKIRSNGRIDRVCKVCSKRHMRTFVKRKN